MDPLGHIQGNGTIVDFYKRGFMPIPFPIQLCC